MSAGENTASLGKIDFDIAKADVKGNKADIKVNNTITAEAPNAPSNIKLSGINLLSLVSDPLPPWSRVFTGHFFL
jgi:hypothetical protein